ncbi:MAG TPA: glycosyltransferase [Acidimicrobiales bacterium]|nr:glycosyltransferase [Acidimicrobiales bacterium]
MIDATPPALSILHVAQPVDHGVARCVAALAADQVERGWQVTVACPGEGWLPDEVKRAGARLAVWPAVRAPHAGLAQEWRSMRATLDVVAPDVVHLHSAKAGLTGRLAARRRAPIVFQPHAWSFLALDGPARVVAERWERIAARWVDTLVCCSGDELERGRRVGVRAEARVVPNSVDLERFTPLAAPDRAALRAALDLPAAAPVAVCAGRLSRQKGQDLLVAAWPAVRARVPEAELVLVGDGPDRAALEIRAGDGVRVVGDQREVAPWLRAADLAVLPSRYEGMALGVLEAMACGRSVVAADADGMREALGAGPDAAGVVVPVEDVAALASAVVERLGDPEVAAAEGSRGRAQAEARFGRQRWLDDLAAIASIAATRRR